MINHKKNETIIGNIIITIYAPVLELFLVNGVRF